MIQKATIVTMGGAAMTAALVLKFSPGWTDGRLVIYYKDGDGTRWHEVLPFRLMGYSETLDKILLERATRIMEARLEGYQRMVRFESRCRKAVKP